MHQALQRFPYRLAAPDLLPAPPAAPIAAVPLASREAAIPARIRERRERFSLRASAAPATPGSPPLHGMAASASDDPVSVIPTEYLS